MVKCEGRGRAALVVGAFSCVVMLLAAAAFLAAPSPALAQEGGEQPPAQPQAQTDQSSTSTTKAKEEPNLLVHIIESAGWFFGPLLFLVSIGLVTLIVLLAMDLRMSVAVPPAFVDDFTDMVNKRQFKQAFDLCRSDNSFLARVMTAGMGRLQYGIEDAREAARNMMESVRASKDTLIAYLATIGTLGPMLGLVGTVFGMIIAFMELSAGGTPRPEKLAAGISHALVVTLLGIALSVPAIFFHAFFKNRLTRISMDTSTLADDLLTQMYHNSKKAAPAAAPAAAAPVAAAATARAPANTASIKPAEG
jgi:biopolymer transport protein ExbB